MELLSFIQNHFWHAFPLLIAAVFAVAIIAERYKTLCVTYSMNNPQGFFEKISELLLQGKTAEAVALCDQYPSKPLSKVVKSALIRAHLPETMIHHGLEHAVGENTQTIHKRTSFLATIANVATLMGLFGTIAGLISSFEAVAHADPQQKSAMLSAGIATAMNATMMGLGVAIPCMVAYSFLMNRSNRLTAEMENAAVKIMELLKQRYYALDLTKVYESEKDTHTNGSGKVVSLGKVA